MDENLLVKQYPEISVIAAMENSRENRSKLKHNKLK